jgi:hypothetical protein
VAGGERVDSLVTGEGEKGLTGGARLLERGQLRGSDGGRADGWGQADSGGGRSAGARAEMGRMGRARDGRAETGGWVDSAQPRGRRFSFFFFYFYFYFFYILFLLNKYLAIYS